MIASAENIVRISPISSIPLKKGTCKSARSCKINVGFVLIPITLKCAVLPWKGPSSWSTDLRKTFSFLCKSRISIWFNWIIIKLEVLVLALRRKQNFAVGGWERLEWRGWRYWEMGTSNFMSYSLLWVPDLRKQIILYLFCYSKFYLVGKLSMQDGFVLARKNSSRYLCTQSFWFLTNWAIMKSHLLLSSIYLEFISVPVPSAHYSFRIKPAKIENHIRSWSILIVKLYDFSKSL